MQPPNKPPTPPQSQRQLRLELPANLNATYANGAIINQTHSEIVIDFFQVMPNDPRVRVQSRIVLTPSNAKSFLNALAENLERFEQVHGEIKLPPKPVSLAEQLFSVARSDDADNPSDNPTPSTTPSEE
ncbi:MAG: DUF3467 domain-containing protein [bacterium]|nr:DUF3467 domain-containing protein [bacterium]